MRLLQIFLPFLAACATKATLDVDGRTEVFVLSVVDERRIHAGPKDATETVRLVPELRQMWYGEALGGEGKQVLHLKGRDVTFLLELSLPREARSYCPPELRGAAVVRVPEFCGTFPLNAVDTLLVKEGAIRFKDDQDGLQAEVELLFASKETDLERRREILRKAGEEPDLPIRYLQVRGSFRLNLH